VETRAKARDYIVSDQFMNGPGNHGRLDSCMLPV
jgi:hypothetical protein